MIKNLRQMKTLKMKNIDEILNEYALTVEEMICVKGGDQGEPIVKTCPPPVKI
jgi:hypothetical protein